MFDHRRKVENPREHHLVEQQFFDLLTCSSILITRTRTHTDGHSRDRNVHSSFSSSNVNNVFCYGSRDVLLSNARNNMMCVIEKKKKTKTKIKTRRKLQKYPNEKTFDQRAIANVRSGEKRKGEGKHSSIRNAFPISSSDISNVVDGEEEKRRKEDSFSFGCDLCTCIDKWEIQTNFSPLFSSVIHVCTYN